jgi:hypothetical protein
MPSSFPFTRAAVAVLTSAAVAGGPLAASASATDATIELTLKRDLPELSRSQLRIHAGLQHFSQTGSSRMLLSAVRNQDAVLRSLRTRIDHEAASSAHGMRGRRDMVQGLGLILQSNTALERVIASRARGRPVSAARMRRAVGLARRGNTEFRRGIRELVRS